MDKSGPGASAASGTARTLTGASPLPLASYCRRTTRVSQAFRTISRPFRGSFAAISRAFRGRFAAISQPFRKVSQPSHHLLRTISQHFASISQAFRIHFADFASMILRHNLARLRGRVNLDSLGSESREVSMPIRALLTCHEVTGGQRVYLGSARCR